MRWDVHYVEQTGSTNADLLALARGGAPPGTVLRAGHQTAGRGRLGRAWEAPPGSSLLASILLPTVPVPFLAVARVALAAAAVCRDLAGAEPALKWPNDLVLGPRKLAGLLAESDGGPTMVVGIGCNVDWPPAGERPAPLRDRLIALSDLAADPPSPAALLDGLLARLDGWLGVRPAEVLAAYRSACATLGRPVRVEMADGAFEGTATALTPSGELVVATGATSRTVTAGDVVHVRPGRPAPAQEQPAAGERRSSSTIHWDGRGAD